MVCDTLIAETYTFCRARIGGVTILRKGGSDFISNGETGNFAYSETLESK